MSKTDLVHLSDLHQDPDNARLHNERNYAAINASIAETGFGRSLLAASDGTLIAGNATAEVLADLDMTQVIVVESDGTKPIVHKRTDIAPGSEMFRKAAFYDNRTAELASWDTEVLAALMQETNIAPVAMTQAEAEALINRAYDDDGRETEPSAPAEVALSSQWLVVIECHDESEQTALLERFLDEGLTCRALTS